jgi:hypothetical protein
MKKSALKWVLGVLISTTILSSCKKDKVEENDEEVITTMILTFVPVGGGTTLTYTYDDADGPGGASATQDQIVLAPSKTYGVTVQLLNKTESPAANITTEILSEADAHRFYYAPTAGSNIAVTGLDNDPNGVPLGVTSTWTTGAVATGNVTITLRHYPGTPPNKETVDPVTSTKSGTDVEVTFSTKIQ